MDRRIRAVSTRSEADGYSRAALLIALLCVLGAVVSLVEVDSFKVRDSNVSVYFVVLALAAMAWPSVRNLRFGKDGVAVEKFDKMQSELSSIDKTVTDLNGAVESIRATADNLARHIQDLEASLEKIDQGNRELMLVVQDARANTPSSNMERADPAAAQCHPAALTRAVTHAADPHKGRFGSNPERNNWRLSAMVRPSAVADDMCMIKLRVASTVPDRRLNGPVVFFVHPTFPKERYEVAPARGVASLELRGWGAFTVGACVMEDKTELELDLAHVEDAPRDFKNR